MKFSRIALFSLIACTASVLAVEQVPISVLIYETESVEDSPADSLQNQASQLNGFAASKFGAGNGFEGYGSKYSAVYPKLKELHPESLVIVSDGRDVLINNPTTTDKFIRTAADDFRATFDELTKSQPGAVVVSAEAQCCVSALTHVELGGYYNTDGSRKEHACSSGKEGCMWDGDEKALPWETFMKDLAIQRGATEQNYDDIYLNAGLMAGTAGDLIKLIEAAQIGKDEDDQAVLTDFMYHYPERIVLDYGQKLFGNNRGGLVGLEEEACAFSKHEDEDRLVHSKTQTTPLFLHSPGGFLTCHDDMAQMLGIKAASKVVRRRLRQKNRKLAGCNYKKSALCDDENSSDKDNSSDDSDDGDKKGKGSPNLFSGLPKFDMPNVKMPKIDVPNIDLPNIDLPNINLPNIDLPNVDLPKLPGWMTFWDNSD